MNDEPQRYANFYLIEAEGWRLGLRKCLRCGAAVFVETDDALGGTEQASVIHDRWHEAPPETPKEG